MKDYATSLSQRVQDESIRLGHMNAEYPFISSRNVARSMAGVFGVAHLLKCWLGKGFAKQEETFPNCSGQPKDIG
jgi:hypothetical protein